MPATKIMSLTNQNKIRVISMDETRKIIHVDMDAFYASVEQRDNPELRNRPVIVGGTPRQRGVVAACSYEARKYGVHSAMATGLALQLCPGAVLIQPRFGAYEHVSRLINRIFREFTDLVEPLSLDEAFLDVTKNKKNEVSATRIAKEIKKRILLRTKLTASAGVSYNKFLAKVASGFKKPDGLTVVTPWKALKFIETLYIGQFYGVGSVTEKKMLSMGIRTGADLRVKSRVDLIKSFGSAGAFFYELARGIDERPVEAGWERRSISRETTFPYDIDSKPEMMRTLKELSADAEGWMVKKKLKAGTITLKVKYFNFKSITRSVSVDPPVSGTAEIVGYLAGLLDKTDAGKMKIRLIGCALSNFKGRPEDGKESGQMCLPL